MKLSRDQKERIREALAKVNEERVELAECLDKYNSEVSSAYGALCAAIETFDAAVESAWDEHVSGAVESYNAVAGELASAIEDTASELRDAWNDRSEKWQESDAGQDAEAFISELESVEVPEFDPDKPDGAPVPDEPDEIEPPDEIDDPTGEA